MAVRLSASRTGRALLPRLVDEYDSLPVRAMFRASEEDLDNITSLPVDIIAPALRYGEHVAGAMLTGISYVAGIGFSVGLKIDRPFRFLDMGKLDKYYGLTQEEANEIMEEFNFSPDEKMATHKAYNGYETKNGLKVYNIWSVIKHIRAVQDHKFQLKNSPVYHGSPVKPKSYWIDSVGIAGMEVPYIKNTLKKCVLDAHIPTEIYHKVTNEDLKILRRLVCEDSDTSPSPEHRKLQGKIKFPDGDLFLTCP
jgi:hypothetical protein